MVAKKWIGLGEGSLVPLVWYETISQYSNRFKAPMSALLFNKLVVLASFRTKEQGRAVEVPYAWYKYGPEATVPGGFVGFETLRELQGQDRDSTSDDTLVSILEDVPDRFSTVVSWRRDRPTHFAGDPTAELIRETIRQLVEQYGPPGLVERAVDETYEHAPYPFQRSFRDVRICMGTTGHGSAREPELRSTDPWPVLEDALDQFPSSKFDVLSDYVEPMRRAFDAAWNQPPSRERGLARELVEEFWLAFCAQLRVHREGHHPSVPHPIVDEWERIAEIRLQKFYRNFGDILVLLSSSRPELRTDEETSEIVEERSSEQAEESKFIKSQSGILSSLDETLSKLANQ